MLLDEPYCERSKQFKSLEFGSNVNLQIDDVTATGMYLNLKRKLRNLGVI